MRCYQLGCGLNVGVVVGAVNVLLLVLVLVLLLMLMCFVGVRYAMLGHEPGAMLLLAVAQQALLQLDNFSPQELTNMVSHCLLCLSYSFLMVFPASHVACWCCNPDLAWQLLSTSCKRYTKCFVDNQTD